MLETIAVLVIFFILFVLGYVFYSKVFKSSVEDEKEENIQLESIKIAQIAASLPELQCSQENVVKDNCIDKYKLKAAEEIMTDSDNLIYYFDKFSFSRIIVKEIYPGTEEWIIYDRKLDVGEFSQKIITNIPITIFDPIENENAFGVMEIALFIK